MKIKKLLSTALIISAAASPAIAADAAMTDTQKKAIETIIHDYLVKNPEVLIEASQVLQQKQNQEMQNQAQSSILKNTDKLFADSITVAGNPKGDVTLVEFFDYQCVHCKRMSPVISGLIKANPNLRVIFKELPIFGKSSEMASKAALAAAAQGKYLAMHEALLKQPQRLTETLIEQAAKTAGLDMTKFKADMKSPKFAEMLEANHKLAEALHVNGTPAFIVAATPNGQFKTGTQPSFIPGAASEETLKDLIKKATD